jgi:hypothetical protein
MSDSTLKSALAYSMDDIEAARDVFVAEAESVADDEIDDRVDEILDDSQDVAETGFVIVKREDLEALRRKPYDARDDLNDAVESFNWRFAKALRELKAALVREKALGLTAGELR